MNSPGKNTGVGCHALLQGIFPTQVSRIAGRFFTIWATIPQLKNSFYHLNFGALKKEIFCRLVVCKKPGRCPLLACFPCWPCPGTCEAQLFLLQGWAVLHTAPALALLRRAQAWRVSPGRSQRLHASASLVVSFRNHLCRKKDRGVLSGAHHFRPSKARLGGRQQREADVSLTRLKLPFMLS